MEPIGLYIHVPFCTRKCPYCDFYSLTDLQQAEAYTKSVTDSLETYSRETGRTADTLYFGGGTPSVLGAARLGRMIDAARDRFGLADAEITVEVNPSAQLEDFFAVLAEKGVNRVSVGLQSAHGEELALLGRGHTAKQAALAVQAAHRAGIYNVSMDLMAGIQKQTARSLKESIAFCHDAGAVHISAYLLKIEPNTPYGRQRQRLALPDDDRTGDLYLMLVEELAGKGYVQYEISNCARRDKDGRLQMSRHNMKYWQCREYLGIGPSAHSFLQGERFYFDRDISAFMAGSAPVADGRGGGPEETAMLALRLTEGLTDKMWRERFGRPLPLRYIQRARMYEKAGLVRMRENGFGLTPEGFLVSNRLIAAILA